MENSREISSLMYLEFSLMYECEEELSSSIVVCVHTLFCECFPLLEIEQFLSIVGSNHLFISDAFGWSWGPLGWTVPSDIFPLEICFATQGFLSLLCSFRVWDFIVVYILDLYHDCVWIPLFP
jgi:hypothetical protein